MNQELSMNANKLVAFLQKPTSEFTKADIISFIQQNPYGQLHVSCGRWSSENFEFCH